MLYSDFKLIKTLDGSYSLHSENMDESYHSVNGAFTESGHVFINTGFNEISKKEISVFEVGFGTGLNCLLTMEEAVLKNKKVTYECIEAYMLEPEIIEKLNYHKLSRTISKSQFMKLHTTRCNELTEIIPESFHFKKYNESLIDFKFECNFDLVYFDAFAPSKQPEMWDEIIFSRIFEIMNTGGILVTYCAMGEVRRRLNRCGFETERLPGPPGKREMLRATKNV